MQGLPAEEPEVGGRHYEEGRHRPIAGSWELVEGKRSPVDMPGLAMQGRLPTALRSAQDKHSAHAHSDRIPLYDPLYLWKWHYCLYFVC